jgi:hypothetical protein
MRARHEQARRFYGQVIYNGGSLMKRLLATALIAAASLIPAAGQALPGFLGYIGQMSAAADLGTILHSDAAGISLDLRFDADLKHSVGFFSPYMGAKLLYGYTSDTSHGESDIYPAIGAGLRLVPCALPGLAALPAILKPLTIGMGLELGVGATIDINSKKNITRSVAGFLFEPSLAFEYPVGPVIACFTPSYRALFTSATVKGTMNLSLGARYLLREAAK